MKNFVVPVTVHLAVLQDARNKHTELFIGPSRETVLEKIAEHCRKRWDEVVNAGIHHDEDMMHRVNYESEHGTDAMIKHYFECEAEAFNDEKAELFEGEIEASFPQIAELITKIKSLLSDIEGMRITEPKGDGESPHWFGPFSEMEHEYATGPVDVEWPNLAISTEEVKKQLEALQT